MELGLEDEWELGGTERGESSWQRAKQIGREVHLPASPVIWEADAGAEGGVQEAYLKVMSVEHKRDWEGSWAGEPQTTAGLPLATSRGHWNQVASGRSPAFGRNSHTLQGRA